MINEVYDRVELLYQTGDSINSVTKDITLPIAIAGYLDASISWQSNNTEVISVTGVTGVVHRQTTNIEVTITATIKINDKERSKPFVLTVIASTGEVDTIKPVISGTKDFTLTIGDLKPNWLDGVSAVDNIDGNVLVTVDDSLVNIELVGLYILVYRASDQAGNTEVIEVNVLVRLDLQAETLRFFFEFPSTDLGHGYSDTAVVADITNSVDNTQFMINKKRANTGVSEEGLVISGASASDTTGYVEFIFTEEISKITFNARIWGENDLANLESAKFQEKVGDTWVDLIDLKVALAGSTTFVLFETSEITQTTFRLYVNGTIGTGNTARLVFDDFKVYVDGGSDQNITFTGLKNYDLILGDDEPNYAEGVTAKDSFGNTIDVQIKDSNVNMQEIGTYVVTLIAIDSLGNEFERDITVVVKDESVGESQTFTENFSTFNSSASSYVAGSFTGVKGITWTYVGARGDIALNGNAITFGGKNTDNSSLKATIDGGISSISIAYSNPFTNSQDYGIYINNVSVGTMNAQGGQGVFTYTLDQVVEGTFTLEIKPVAPGLERKQVTIDDITWQDKPVNTKPQSQLNAESDRNTLTVPLSYIANQVVDFIKVGAKGSVISWAYTNLENSNNSLVNFETGQVNIPESGQVLVSVTATIINAEFSYQKTFSLMIGEGNAVTVSAIKALSSGSHARTKGVITSIYKTATEAFFFIEDTTAGIFVSSPILSANALKVGDEIEIKGSKNVVSGQVLINEIRQIIVIGTKAPTSTVATKDSLSTSAGKYVSLSGLISRKYTTSTDSFILETIKGSVTLLIPSNLDIVEKTAIVNKLININAGTNVSVLAPVYQQGSNYYLYITSATSLVVDQSIDFNQVSSVILANVLIPNYEGYVSSNLTLTSSNSLLFGATINWVSSNPTVLSHTGVITAQENDTVVNLTYTITFDSEVVETKTFAVTVMAQGSFEGYYASLNGLTGNQLKAELTSMIKTKGFATGSTSQVQTVDSYQGKYYLIYTGFGAYGNREHVWPNSKLQSAPDYDLHNLRAANTGVNSTRSNYPFTNSVTGLSWQKVGSAFYPGSEHVGDVARIILYMFIRYNLTMSDVGNLNMFLTWHEQDPVSDFEISRNGKIESIQNSRNPFIDHPELVNVLFS